MAQTRIDGSQIKPESIDGGEIKDGSIQSADIAIGAITADHISASLTISADKLTEGTNAKIYTTTEKTKLNGIHASAQIKILNNESSAIWTHNFGSTNYAVNVITDNPAVLVYFSSLAINSIVFNRGQILGAPIGDFANSITGDITLLVTLIPIG